jgi:hypothetical protein
MQARGFSAVALTSVATAARRVGAEWPSAAGAARVATPVSWPAPPAPAPTVAPAVVELVLGFPEPALVFDRRCVCVCLNDHAARGLGVNPDRVDGLGALALGLPTEVADVILSLTDPRAPPGRAERVIDCVRGTSVRRFRATPHVDTGELLVTWVDLPGPVEGARQLATLQEALRGLRERTQAEGLRRRDALTHLGAQLELTAAALGAVREELAAKGWGLPPGRAADEVLAEETERLREVLAELARLGREPELAPVEHEDAVIEL